MKENTNIEDLFKDKFENFEANVDPAVWANVSQSINAGAVGSGAAGLSSIAKVAVITAAVAVTSVSVWYFTKDTEQKTTSEQEQIISPEHEENEIATVSIDEENIQVSDTNDPVLKQNMEEIREDFVAVEISTENFDEELIDILLENQSTVDGNNQSNETSQESSGNGSSESTESSETVVSNENVQDVNEEGITTEVEKKDIKTNLQYNVFDTELEYTSGAKNHLYVEWSFGDETSAKGDEGSHIYKRPGKYLATMKVVGENNTKEIQFPVEIEGTSEISEIPNVITPNNDGANDYFFIKSTDIEEFTITVYNMQGEMVFTSDDPDFRWYGEGPSGEVKPGKYLFKLLAVGADGAIYKEAKMLNITK